MLLPPIGVFTLAFSLAALSIVGVGAVSSTVLPSRNTAKFLLPSCPLYWGRTFFQASLPWLMLWSRGPRARAPVPPYTFAILKALSAGGVSGSSIYNAPHRPVATPTLLRQGGSSSRSPLLFFSNLKGFLESPKLHRARQPSDR